MVWLSASLLTSSTNRNREQPSEFLSQALGSCCAGERFGVVPHLIQLRSKSRALSKKGDFPQRQNEELRMKNEELRMTQILPKIAPSCSKISPDQIEIPLRNRKWPGHWVESKFTQIEPSRWQNWLPRYPFCLLCPWCPLVWSQSTATDTNTEDEITMLRARHKNAVPASTQLNRAARRWMGNFRFFRCKKRILIFFGFERLNKLTHRKAI